MPKQEKETRGKDKQEKNNHDTAAEKAAITLPGVVEKIIPPVDPAEPEKAQIAIDGADHLYREIRVDNVLKDGEGKEVGLKKGAEVDVTIAAQPDATATKKRPKSDAPSSPVPSKKK
jgi:hypothetical protein